MTPCSTGASNKPDPLLPRQRLHQKGCSLWTPMTSVTAAPSQSHRPTSSTVSSCGVAALSSESFWEPASALFRTSLLFLCLWANFLACPSALPLLSLRTGLVSHLRRVLPGRLGPGELCAPIMWGWREATEAGGLASLLETESESEGTRRKKKALYWTGQKFPGTGPQLYRLSGELLGT